MRAALCAAALAASLAWGAPAGENVRAAAVCRAVPGAGLALPGRVDGLLAAAAPDTLLVLVGRAGSQLPYIPHDSLLVLGADGWPGGSTNRVSLPSYVMPPGLALAPGGRRVYVLVDSQMLTVDAASGRILARQDLALQAIGAPAALTTDAAGDVFLIGQPDGAWAAQADGFRPDKTGALRPIWHVALSPTHAGSWMGDGGHGQVAVFTPDQHDQHGTLALLEEDNGTLRGSYSLVMPPAALDAAHDRLYLAGGGIVRALELQRGRPTAAARGDGPLAVDTASGRVAFVRDGRVVVARGDTLQDLASAALPGGALPTALAWSGSSLVVGTVHGLARLTFPGCVLEVPPA